MSSFDELMMQLRSAAGEDADLTPYDELTSSYVSATEGAAASIAEKEATIAELSQQVSALKAQNYDLLMQVSASAAPIEQAADEDDNVPDEDAAEDDIDDLFEDEEH